MTTMRCAGGVRRRGTGAATKKEMRHPSTTDIAYDGEETELLRSMEEFKKRTGKKFPSFTDVLHVLKQLGWRRPQWDEMRTGAVLGDGASPRDGARLDVHGEGWAAILEAWEGEEPEAIFAC